MDCLVAFPDFIYAFQVQFVYEEFLKLCLEVYSSVLAVAIRANSQSTSPSVVVVPTSTSHQKKLKDEQLKHIKEGQNIKPVPENVDAVVFLSLLEEQLDSRKLLSHPPVDVLRHLVGYKDRVSYYEFVSLVVKSEEVNAHAGVLPSRDKLFVGSWSPASHRKQVYGKH